MPEVIDIIANRLDKALEVIRRQTEVQPTIGVVLGSGQGGFSRRLAGATTIPYGTIPFFFRPYVPGHEGIMTFGRLEGKNVVVLEGRIHQYEGYFMREITFPIRVLHRLGVREMIICNASGALHDTYAVGDVMMLTDHINFMGTNPLIGQIHQDRESPFVNMHGAYDTLLMDKARQAAAEMSETLREGVLVAVSGPCFETPAESRMLAALGGDAVTMSSVPEVIMAKFLGVRVLGFSLITNVHGPEQRMDHREVLAVAYRRGATLMDLIGRVVAKM